MFKPSQMDLYMHQEEIAIVDKRSDYTGDQSRGHVRIRQTIIQEGITFTVYTDKISHRVTVYQDAGNKLRKHEFDISTPVTGVPIVDLRGASIKERIGDNKYKDIENVGYGANDGSGRKHVRNNIVLDGEPMIPDSSFTTTNDDLSTRYPDEFAVAKFAIQEQNAYIKRIMQAFASVETKAAPVVNR